MYLKSVEINGFKSFAEKTNIDFPKGIISVVGPNGSGKSNILDAVLWVLGEQSYKNIRAKESQDVIFSGGKNARAKNFAEVSLVIDNEDHALNIEYTEIKITRRIYISGENEYFINNNKTRLKDIQELFMDTGIGKSAYSVIGQGKVEEILISTPRELRGLIEEAAGIKKVKKRKEESEKNLAEIANNIEKIELIENEIMSSMAPLKIQAEKARKYKELKEEHRIMSIALFKRELFFKENQAKGISHKLSELEIKVREFESEYEKTGTVLNEVNQLRVKKSEELEKLSYEMEVLRNELQKSTNDDTLFKERISNFEKEIIEKQEQEKIASEKVRDRENIIGAITAEAESYRKAYEEQESEIKEINSEIIVLEEDKLNTETAVKELKKKVMDLEIIKIRAQNEIENLDRNIMMISVRLDKLAKEKELKSEEKKSASADNENISLEIGNLEKKREALLRNIGKFTNEAEEHKISRNSLDKEIHEINRNTGHMTVRLESLEAMERSYDGFFKGVKELLVSKITGIIGPFISIVTIPDFLESAMEAVIGNSMQDIVVLDSACAKTCVEYLKKHSLGRASFLPLDTIKPYENRGYPKTKGVMGLASELMEFDKQYEKAIKFVLGNILVVENIDIGIEISKANGFSGTIVSLDGEVISGRGKITGGEKIKSSISMVFERKREMKKLSDNLAAGKNELSDKKNKLAGYDEEIGRIEKELVLLKEEMQSINEGIREKQNKQNEIIKENNKIDGILKVLNSELNEERERETLFKEKIKKFSEDLDKSSTEIAVSNSSILEKENRVSSLAEKIKEINESYSGKRIEFAKISEKIENTKTRIDYEKREAEIVFRQIKEIAEKIKYIKTEVEEYRKKALNAKQITEELEKKIEINNIAHETVRSEYKKDDEEEKELINRLRNIEIKLMQEKDGFTRKVRDYERLEIEIGELRANLSEYIKEPEENIPMADDDNKAKKHIAHFEEEIKKLGDVNLLAIEDYERLKEKHDFMSQQKIDLSESGKVLKKLIIEIEDEIKSRFVDAFNEINKNFDYTCSELLNNSTGEIQMEDMNNVLESGIELIVKFKTKKAQSLTLLSGGEKSMVAVAFIISIFMYKPTPFTFFDEIEAALDESNTKKLIRMLKTFTNSQFVLITHNKETMKESDVLYGVTMNKEEGISKIISINI